ncbi:hypothetical protein [Stenotrophomonas maltophilia]|uniref:hypothetical protein n=1 Tax=Stenotrophomonas maltophilia TaxID=40324 RepID=UPI0016613EBD|nr:hypothetical protein [Stenotrophomonas maltophilia]
MAWLYRSCFNGCLQACVFASNDFDGLQNGAGVIQATSAAVMEDIEWYVYLLTLDDYSPHAFVGRVAGAADPERWSFAVELTYRCLSAGLWRLTYHDLLEDLGLPSIDAFCHKLSVLRPDQLSDEGQVLWLDTYMEATELCLDLVSRYLRSQSSGETTFHPGFQDEIERMFSDAGVPWSRGPLFPIA